MATPWPSAMATSKNRSGNSLAKGARPVPSAMAAVMAQMRLSSAAQETSVRPNTAEKSSPPLFFKRPVSGSKGPTPWNLSGFCSAKE